MQNLSFALFLEGSPPASEKSFFERILDYLVRRFQPSPSCTHVELFVPPLVNSDEPHFSTYLGLDSTKTPPVPFTANWGSQFGGGREFYTNPKGNLGLWRAVPIVGEKITIALRNEASKHVETPYGLVWRIPWLYVFAVPPFRAFAGWLSDETAAPAHCATLVARILKGVSVNLDKPSTWYGPSTLLLELTRQARMSGYSKFEVEGAQPAQILVQERNEDVQKMAPDDYVAAIKHLTNLVIDASVAGDVENERIHQQNLAKALLRFEHQSRQLRV